ncbi:hypothetical protein DFA_04521 [Cavenderia fasciculata]|uniref:Uncharacterized protein n=1 Tax=Cavenderia fasciculata TaxID=261658 RepID=F4PPT9_CACFS|nr:uncharacterized protein DFA_04521 [Cavenderia fasciculata]EGG22402.1 hypothetical protein DFA_04521 [Cavenderia fasciculata]|eukprot:XP_004360253.1 hypothetical protein DFA_04521 [Cavenderia fasciculata]
MTHYIERTWDDLKNVINEDRLGELGRKDQDTTKMMDHMVYVRATYSSTKDYILSKMFDFPTEDDHQHPIINNVDNNITNQNNDNNNNNDSSSSDNSNNNNVYKKKVVRPVDVKQKLAFKLNDFPYNCHDSITHWVLWCLQPLTHQEAKEHLITHFQHKLQHQQDFLFFINPVELQSIREVTHYHVFVKNDSFNRLDWQQQDSKKEQNSDHCFKNNTNCLNDNSNNNTVGQIASGTTNTVPSF